MTYLVSAVLLLTVRQPEAPPPLKEDREPVLDEIRHGLRLVRHDPVLRAFAGAQMLLSALWGIFGATWFLFALDELGVTPALVGVIAGVGGASSFIGAVVATRSTRRWGVGPVAIAAMLLAALGNLFIPLAPAGLPFIAVVCLVAQQLIADSAITVYDVTEVSVRQTLVADRELGRVTSTFFVASAAAQLTATIAAGLLAEVIGLRAVSFLAPLGGCPGRRRPVLVAGADLAGAPVDGRPSPAEVALEVERDQPVGA